MRKIFFNLTLLASLLVLLLPAPSVAEPIKCGVALPLTGKVALWGSWIRNGIELAHADTPSKAVEFLFEDDQYTPRQTVTVVQRFLSVEKANCLITFGSSTSLAVQQLAEKSRIPMYAMAISPNVGKGLEFVTRQYIPVTRQVEALHKEVLRRKYSSVAIVTSEHDATIALRDAFVNTPPFPVLYDQSVDFDPNSVATVALKIKQANPAAVFLNLLPPMAAHFSRQLRHIDYQGPFFAGPPIESKDELVAAHGTLDGAWFITADYSPHSEFGKRYQKLYGTTPGVLAVYAYDIAKIILTRPDDQPLATWTRSLKGFSGLAGTYGWNGTEFDIPAAVWEITGFEYNKRESTAN